MNDAADVLMRLLPFHITGNGNLTQIRTWWYALVVGAANGLYLAVIAAIVTAAVVFVTGLVG